MSEAAETGKGVPQEVTLAKRAGKTFFPVRLGPSRFASLADIQDEPCLDGSMPSTRWTDEVREFLAGVPLRSPGPPWWRRPGTLAGVAATVAVTAAALLTGAALLDHPETP